MGRRGEEEQWKCIVGNYISFENLAIKVAITSKVSGMRWWLLGSVEASINHVTC